MLWPTRIAHVALGEDDAVRADALEDPAVRRRDRLGHDASDSEVGEDGRRQDAGLHVGPDRDDRGPELRRADLRHRLGIGRIALDDVRQLVCVPLHGLLAEVDAEHLVAELDERLGKRAAETAEPDDEELLLPGHAARP